MQHQSEGSALCIVAWSEQRSAVSLDITGVGEERAMWYLHRYVLSLALPPLRQTRLTLSEQSFTISPIRQP
jgi:hypothetical protein